MVRDSSRAKGLEQRPVIGAPEHSAQYLHYEKKRQGLEEGLPDVGRKHDKLSPPVLHLAIPCCLRKRAGRTPSHTKC
jgi:hypothetical protein